MVCGSSNPFGIVGNHCKIMEIQYASLFIHSVSKVHNTLHFEFILLHPYSQKLAGCVMEETIFFYFTNMFTSKLLSKVAFNLP